MIIPGIPFNKRFRKGGNIFPYGLKKNIRHLKRGKVGIRKIPVIIRFFFGTHGESGSVQRIKTPGLLLDNFSSFNDVHHPGCFIFNSALYIPDGIEVLDLHPGAECGFSFFTDRYIGIAAHTAFFHISVTDFQIA